MSVLLYPYSTESKTALNLAKGAGTGLIKPEGSAYIHNPRNLIVNWGSVSKSLTEYQNDGPVLNPTALVKRVNNKKRFFDALSANFVRIPDYTENSEQVKRWVREGSKVIGYNESDISLIENLSNKSNCTFFTKYIPKLWEFRVHIFNNTIIGVERKTPKEKDNNEEAVNKEFLNYHIRSNKNGFCYTMHTKETPQDVLNQATAATRSMDDFSFGAVDLIYNKKQNKAFVIGFNLKPLLNEDMMKSYTKMVKTL